MGQFQPKQSNMTTIMTTFQADIFTPTTLATDLDTTGYLMDSPFNQTSLIGSCLPHAKSAQSPVLFYTVFSPIFFLGIVGNSMLILIFVLQKSMRTAPNRYIFNLAVADLLTTLSCAMAPLLQTEVQKNPVLCKLFQAVMETSFGVCSYTLAALSVERYYAIARPFQSRVSSKRFTLLVVTLIWFWCVTYVIGKILLMNHSECQPCAQMFDPASFANTYIFTDFIAFYLIPLAIIADFYIMMAQELFYRPRSLPKGSIQTTPASRHLQVRKKIAKTILVLVAMFVVFYLPFNFMSLKLYFDGVQAESQSWAPFVNLLFCVGCLHNSFNPVVLYFLSESFRGHFNNYLFYSIFLSPKPVKDEHHDCQCTDCVKNAHPEKVAATTV